MTQSSWDQPGDDGVLDDADTLASDDMRRDRLDTGIDPPEGYSAGERWGTTETEARQGESLDQLLAEEEPERGRGDPPPEGDRSAEQAAMHVEGVARGQRAKTPATPAPSGKQYEISLGEQHAVVVEVGGGIRFYRVGDRHLLDGYPRNQRCTGARGLPLTPWPNRIQDGVYTFDGTDYQVPLTEPESHNAIHGFGRWRNWTCRRHSPHAVVMGTVLHPQMGYPFTVDVTVSYTLADDGLTVRTTASNVGDQPCPYGTGQHPYLTLGTGLVDPCALTLDADRWIPTDDRGLPTGHASVDGSAYDFRAGRQIGPQDIDYTFTDLARDPDGRAWVRLTDPDGAQVALWADQAYPFIEIYTAHTQPGPYWRTGLGVEPMTCAPNAFRSGEGLIRLAPGESSTATWGLSVAVGNNAAVPT